ncbi:MULTISPECIES: hypothetical protein [unclassified Carboxylicivirga]|uniref:hypothetical protein n=1 Tax=Carboxylicivirga TaxID=1628153 RepID=UPI003D33C10D
MKSYLFLLIILLKPIFIYSQTNLADNSEIVKNSLNGLELINDQWNREVLFSVENKNEQFIYLKQVQNTLFAISQIRIGNQYDEYLNVFTINSSNRHRVKLNNVKFGIFNSANFRLKDNKVSIFVSNEKLVEYQYDLEDKELINVLSMKIQGHASAGRSSYRSSFPSRSGRFRIEFKDVDLILHKMKIVEDDFAGDLLVPISSKTLISQQYDGSWSFGSGVWNNEETKFYFDNTGAVACIWELDVEKNTLNKIVPEHEAFNPFIINNETEKVLGFFLGNSIMIAKPGK